MRYLTFSVPLSLYSTSCQSRFGNVANVFCFLSSLPHSPQPLRQCLAPTCHLSTLNLHCILGACLPIHMIGDKKKTSVDLLVFGSSVGSGLRFFLMLSNVAGILGIRRTEGKDCAARKPPHRKRNNPEVFVTC
jgi:hypothetical protein